MKKIYCMFLLFSTCFLNCMMEVQQIAHLVSVKHQGDTYEIKVPATFSQDEVNVIKKICAGQNSLDVIEKEFENGRALIASIVAKKDEILGKLIGRQQKFYSPFIMHSLNENLGTKFTSKVIIQTKAGKIKEIDAFDLMRIFPEKPGIIDRVADSVLLALPSIIGFALPTMMVNEGDSIISCDIFSNKRVDFFAKTLVVAVTMLGIHVSHFVMGWKVLPKVKEYNSHMIALKENDINCQPITVPHEEIQEKLTAKEDKDWLDRGKRWKNATSFAYVRMIGIPMVVIEKLLESTSWYKLRYAMQGVRGLLYFGGSLNQFQNSYITTRNTGGLSAVSSPKDCQSGLSAILNINISF